MTEEVASKIDEKVTLKEPEVFETPGAGLVVKPDSKKCVKTIIEEKKIVEEKTAVQLIRDTCRLLELEALKANSTNFPTFISPDKIYLNEQNAVEHVSFDVPPDERDDEKIERLAHEVLYSALMPDDPELKKLEQKAAIFSMGCILFELVAGSQLNVHPKGKSTSFIDRCKNIESIVGKTNLSEDVQNILFNCFQTNPKKGYKLISQLEHDLSALLLNAKLSYSRRFSDLCKPWLAAIGLVLIAVGATFIHEHPDILTGHHHYYSYVKSYEEPPPVKTYNLKNRFSGRILYSEDSDNLATVLQHAAKRNISLNGVDLRDAQLSNARLHGIDLNYADLTGANLQHADLRQVNLRHAVMSGVNLRYSYLFGVDLKDAQLNSADLTGAETHFTNVQEADLSYAGLQGTQLQFANLAGTNFTKADLRSADLSGANCADADFHAAGLMNTKFNRTYLNRANFLDSYDSLLNAKK